jgi:hypothetical protein
MMLLFLTNGRDTNISDYVNFSSRSILRSLPICWSSYSKHFPAFRTSCLSSWYYRWQHNAVVFRYRPPIILLSFHQPFGPPKMIFQRRRLFLPNCFTICSVTQGVDGLSQYLRAPTYSPASYLQASMKSRNCCRFDREYLRHPF